MQRNLIVINIILVVTAGIVFWLLVEQGKANRKVAAELLAATAARQSILSSATRTNDAHRECRQEIGRLEGALSNALALTQLYEARLFDLETVAMATLPTSAPPSVAFAPPGAAPPLSIPPPRMQPTSSLPAFYETLRGAGGRVLGTNLEFSAVYGRRVAFKEIASPRRVAFDLDELDPSVLTSLGIDPAVQKDAQIRQDHAWRRLQAYGQALAAADERQRQERKAAREAAWAEAERKMAQQQQQEEQPIWVDPDPNMFPDPAPFDPAYPPPAFDPGLR